MHPVFDLTTQRFQGAPKWGGNWRKGCCGDEGEPLLSFIPFPSQSFRGSRDPVLVFFSLQWLFRVSYACKHIRHLLRHMILSSEFEERIFIALVGSLVIKQGAFKEGNNGTKGLNKGGRVKCGPEEEVKEHTTVHLLL